MLPQFTSQEVQAHSQNFRRGVTWMSVVYVVCMYKQACKTRGLGACSPRKFLEIRCSEIASEAILGRKQSHCSYMAHGVLHPTFDCPCGDSLSQLSSNFHERRYYGWQNSRWKTAGGVRSLEERLK